MALIQTPCRKICVMDTASGLCTGCGRTLDEIMRWALYEPEQRTRVMAELPARMIKANLKPQTV